MNRTTSVIFADNVRSFCRAKNIPLNRLEQEVDMSPGYLSRISSGRSIGLDLAIRICRELGKDINDMIEPTILLKLELEYHKKMIIKLESQL